MPVTRNDDDDDDIYNVCAFNVHLIHSVFAPIFLTMSNKGYSKMHVLSNNY